MMNISHVLFFSVTVLLIERAGGRKGLYMEYNEETEERGLRRLSSNALKLTACVCMAVDHIGIVFMDNNYIMRAGVWHFLYLHSCLYRGFCVHPT